MLKELFQEIDQNEDLLAAPIDVILPAMDKPIDDLIDQAYSRSDLAITMLSALRDPLVKRWPKALRKELRIPMIDCKVMGNRIYYRDRLFAPPDACIEHTPVDLRVIRDVSKLSTLSPATTGGPVYPGTLRST